MNLLVEQRDDCSVVRLTGSLEPADTGRVRRVLIRLLGERPRCLIWDVSHLASIDSACAPVLAPPPQRGPTPTRVVVVGANDVVAATLAGDAVSGQLPRVGSVESALEAEAADR